MKSYPPRESRLRKAALTLLVAASAAVFVCAPGNAVVEIKTIEITQMTVSATDIFEGESHTATASLVVKPGRILDNLDNRPVRVDWTVEADGDDDPEHEWTNNNPGASSDFTFTYDGLGSTTGSAVVVKAVAFDALGDSDAAETTINVWTKSETVSIVSQTSDHDLVGATTTDVAVQTDVGFYRVDWSIDGGTPISQNGPGLTSQITYDFSTVPYGNTVAFTATPYGVNANGEAVAGNAATINIRVVEPISSVTVNCPDNVVAGEQFFLSASSDAPFHTVRWFVGESTTHVREVVSDNYGDRYASEYYAFESGSGSDAVSGEEYTIRAVAYAVDPATLPADHLPPSSQTPIIWGDIKPDTSPPTVSAFVPDEKSIFVHEGKGKSCRGVKAHADGFEIDENHMCTVYWSHGISYYNDKAGETADLYAFCKMYQLRKRDDGEIPDPDINNDEEIAHYHAPNKAEDGTPYILYLDLKFDHTIIDNYGTYATCDGVMSHIHEELEEDEHYYVHVLTRLNRIDEWDCEDRAAGVITVPFEYTGSPGWISSSYRHYSNPTFKIHPKKCP